MSLGFCIDFWKMTTPSVQVSESVHLSVVWNVTNTVEEVHMALRKDFASVAHTLSATVDVL